MRVLMACAAFPPFIDGGGPISALLLAKMLLAEGHDLRVVNMADTAKHETVEGIEVHRIRPANVYWNYRRPRPAWKKLAWHALENGNPRAYAAMRREIRDFAPDILLTDSIENINVASWAAARSLGVPVAHTLRSVFLLCWRGSMQKGSRNCEGQCATCWVSSLGKKHFSRYVDGVCGETNDVIARHVDRGYFPNALTRQIPGAIEKIAVDAPRAAPANRALRVGFLGVHTLYKGLDVLGRAALILGDREMEFHVAGTGTPADERELRAQFPEHNTRFWGWTDQQTFFPEIDVLVFPSTGREAFGRVAVEAFAYAVPVIGSDLGGIAETVEPGRNGLLFAPGDAEALAANLTRLAESPDLYARLSCGALESAQTYLRPRIAALNTAFLEDTLHRHASRTATPRDEVAL
ncbi:glycosyltransferase [Stappia sp. ES.058]|uniref:glycosyltransferase n=1 Tax=Stappia sp. ES.058 TaxID=1881061 RepID=UPI00087B64DD|nr:glycosyltransferase [Stappia sp. ES.058]SDU48826.1 Glycosyltransferase involved in cell wall bisynthesis [Stappia sp. ES.058]